MMDRNLLLNDDEIRFAEKCLRTAIDKGAQKVRVALAKNLSEELRTLNGELDNVAHCLDRGVWLNLFVDGKYGSFSTNRLDDSELEQFVGQAMEAVRMLAEDRFNDLPDPSRTVKDATEGNELQLLDDSIAGMTPERRVKTAIDADIFNEYEGKSLISLEGEYSDSISDRLIIDSQGLRCRQSETLFSYGAEATIKDAAGGKFSGYWWDRSSKMGALRFRNISTKAYDLAMAQAGPRKIKGGKYNIVVDANCASTLLNPVLNALNANAINQKRSFLMDSLGKKVFHEGLSIIDEPRRIGETGSRMFDAEGVATFKAPIIEGGVIKEYFVSTYMANKLGLAPTITNAIRPVVKPFGSATDRAGILKTVGRGVLVTGFNGGNSNPTTGAFSFGIEGFYFEDGEIVHPVREMLVTGNFIDLWNSLIAAGADARVCMSKLIPTLAFENVDISA